MSPVETLSDRELEVFGMLGQVKATRQIAEELNPHRGFHQHLPAPASRRKLQLKTFHGTGDVRHPVYPRNRRKIALTSHPESSTQMKSAKAILPPLMLLLMLGIQPMASPRKRRRPPCWRPARRAAPPRRPPSRRSRRSFGGDSVKKPLPDRGSGKSSCEAKPARPELVDDVEAITRMPAACSVEYPGRIHSPI